jgi:hypothetical protein
VWAQSAPSSASLDGSTQSMGGAFPSGLHFSSPDMQGHPNPNGRFAQTKPSPFAPAARTSSFGQALPPPSQGFSSPYGSVSRLPNGNGNSQPNSPGVYASSFGSSPRLPNPTAPAFNPAQLSRSPSNQTAASQQQRSAYNPYAQTTSVPTANGSTTHGYPTGPGSLNPASQPFTMRPNSHAAHHGVGSPASHGAPALPPPPLGTPQGVWLPVVPMPSPQPNASHNNHRSSSTSSTSSYNPYSQAQSTYGMPSPNQGSFSTQLPPASPYNNANLPNQNHFSNPKPYRSNLSEFSSSGSPTASSQTMGRQAPPHQSGGGGSGMFSNGRGGPIDQARERERERERDRERQAPPHQQQQQQQQPVFASIGGAFVPQNGAGGNAGGAYGGGGGARRTGW